MFMCVFVAERWYFGNSSFVLYEDGRADVRDLIATVRDLIATVRWRLGLVSTRLYEDNLALKFVS